MKRIYVVLRFASALSASVALAGAPAIAAQEYAAADQVKGPGAPVPAKTPAAATPAEQEMHCDVEAKCLAKLRGIASRSGRNLNLKLENGTTKQFRSTDACETVGDSCRYFSLLDYRPAQHLFVLKVLYYEGKGSIVVSRRTGETFEIQAAEPKFSPDATRFAVVAVSEQDGINQLEVYSTNVFPPALEWSHRPKKSWFDFVAWNGNDQIKLRAFGDNPTAAEMTRTSTGWKLTPPDG